ncbi:LysM peptidoglycan-binding domain-containing protein [Clostridium fungisolvens]|uniref:LysM domain-containing protein n=1 Tax=Clostridium fungisolvens TaxID=1604897 RepID=A0A6V8SLI8_9CLOT|nr:LysM domain-containing protein [Clostridium fungisolvens]GFP75743.1 hypothetical protein bsdtw1_01835 [Clostridium fungisolvens]
MIIYKVLYGDTLYSIDHNFRTYPEELVKINNIVYPYQLFEGKELIIPNATLSRELNSKDQSLLNDLATLYYRLQRFP